MAQENGLTRPRRILVTGASGLLGLNLALEASREHAVFGLVNDHRLDLAASGFEHRFSVLEGDLLVPGTAQRLMDQIQPDWVIHCAALANLDACEADPARARQLNTQVPRTLAKIVASCGARLLHVSTDAVFDGRTGGYTEEHQPHPTGIYAKTKLAGEQAVLDADVNAIVARVNLFGYSLSGKRSLAEFFLYNLLAGKTVFGFTDVFFCPLLVNDLARIFIQMLDLKLSGLYHAVSSDCLTKYEFGRQIARLFDLDERLIQPASVAQADLKAVRSKNLTLSTIKLSLALGNPTPTIEEGLDRFHKLFKTGYPSKIQQLAGIRPLE